MINANRFTRGTGVFQCRKCARKTREVGDGASAGMCDDCYELCVFENRADNQADNQSDNTKLQESILELKKIIFAKGGILK